MSDTAVVFNVLARDRASKVFDKIRRSANESGAGIKAALGPGLLPALAASTGAAAGLGAALMGAGAAVGVFGAVTKSAFTEVQEASSKSSDLMDKITLLREQIRVANENGLGSAETFEKALAKAMNERLARYNLMPPALRNVTMALDDMKASWKGFVEQNKPQTYAVMTGAFNTLSTIIPKLQPLFDAGAAAANRLVVQITAAAGGGGFERFVGWMSSNAGPAIDNLVGIFGNLGVTVYNIFQSFDTSGQGVLKWLNDVTAKWKEWSAQAEGGGLQSFVDSVNSSGPGVAAILGNIGTAAKTIYQAVSPLAPVSLAVAGALTAIIAAMPPAVITALVAGWVAYTVAMKAYHAYVLIVGTATKVWAGIQWLMNTALLASPVTWIVLAIIALVAIIVLVATKTQFFQTIWAAVWGFLKKVGAWFAGPFANFFVSAWGKLVGAFNTGKARVVGIINMLKSAFALYWTAYQKIMGWIISKGKSVVSFFVSMPGKIKGALSGMFNGLWTGFKSVVNKLIGGWNRLDFTIGGGSFAGISIPSASFGTPDIPYLAKGGNIRRSGMAMVGDKGPELLSLNRGAQVTPLSRTGGGRPVIVLDPSGGTDDLARAFLKMLRTKPAFAAGIRDAVRT